MVELRRTVFLVSLATALFSATSLAGVLGDITMNRHSTENGVPAVIFPHWKHRIFFRCYACHPDIFEMEAGKDDVTMKSLQAGAFCGRCHDGKTAWAIGFNTCRNCHSLGEM